MSRSFQGCMSATKLPTASLIPVMPRSTMACASMYLLIEFDQVGCVFGSRENGGCVRFREFLGLCRMVHGAELWPAHGTECRILEPFFGQRFIMHGFGRFRVKRKRKLLTPVKVEARP